MVHPAGAIAGRLIGILYVILAGMKEVGYLNVINALVKYGGYGTGGRHRLADDTR